MFPTGSVSKHVKKRKGMNIVEICEKLNLNVLILLVI